MKCSKDIQNRIKRVQGQIQGILNMMDDERTCEEIVTQLSAVRSSVDKAIALIATQNLMSMIEENHNIEIRDVESAVNLLVKSK